jgi:hypothetical protein
LRDHRYTHANYCFATIYAAPKLVGLRHLGCVEGRGQCYSIMKNGIPEMNRLATKGCQREAMLWRNCHVRIQNHSLGGEIVKVAYVMKGLAKSHRIFKPKSPRLLS